MRRIALILAVAVVAATAAAAQGQTRTPTLKVVDTRPLVVTGAGFVPRERVTVTALTLLGPRIQRTQASATGTFRVRFRLYAQPCAAPFAVRARGGTGDAAITRVPAPPCVPPPVE